MDLDELLAASVPPVTARTPQLKHELDDLVDACVAAESRQRWPVRAAVVSGAFAGVLSVGAVAAAAGVLPGWPSYSTSSGQTCEIELSASALGPGEGEQPIAASFSSAERQATLTEAQAFLADFDYAAVDRQQAIAWWKAEEARARASQADPAERQPRLSGDDLEVTAITRWVLEELDSDLAANGLDIRAIAVSTSSSGCVL